MPLLAALALLLQASAPPAPAPLTGIWAVGEASECQRAGANAWVLMADGLYAETTLPQGPITALGRWRDGGDRLFYTHAHIPFEQAASGYPERAMVMTSRTAERLVMQAPSGRQRVFSRCPASALVAPPGQAAH
jgi:hypothetical protein